MKTRLLLAAALMSAAPATAEEWEVIVNPYFMVPATGGKFGVGPFETNFSMSPSELFSRMNWGVMGAVEVNNGDWGFAAEANYLNLDAGKDRFQNLSMTGHQGVYTFTVLKRVQEHAEVYVGLRVTDYGLSLSCSPSCPVPPQLGGGTFNGTRSRNRSWTEPVLGLRTRLPFSESLELVTAVDVGGFKVGSDMAVNVWPQLAWKMSRRSSLMAGYRVIYVKYDEGEGRDRFLYDGVTQGPTLGLEFRF